MFKRIISAVLAATLLFSTMACANSQRAYTESLEGVMGAPAMATAGDATTSDEEADPFDEISCELTLPNGDYLLNILNNNIDTQDDSEYIGTLPTPPLVMDDGDDENDDPNANLNPDLAPVEFRALKTEAYDDVKSMKDAGWKDKMQAFQRHVSGKALILANQVLQIAAVNVAAFAIDSMLESILSASGCEAAKSTDEQILEQIQIIDDIYESVTRIEEKITTLNKQITDQQYAKALAERRNQLSLLYYTTNEKYIIIVEYLSEGYEEFVEWYAVMDALDNDTITDEQLEYLAQAQDIYTFKNVMARAYMQSYGGLSLRNFMASNLLYQLTFDDEEYTDEVSDILNDWANQYIAGTKVLDTVKNMLLSYKGGTALNSRTIPEIYDYLPYTLCAWEHQGYDTRETLRATDQYIMSQAITVEYLYYTMCIANDSMIEAQDELSYLNTCITKYNDVQTEHKVVRHEDYYICQIKGAEIVFAKTPVYYDYYSQFKNYLNGVQICKEDRDNPPLTNAANKAFENLFRDTAITYDYSLLDDTLKDKMTFNHDEIGNAANPYANINWTDIDTFATPIKSDSISYVTLEQYQAIWNYFKDKGYKYENMQELLKDQLGIEFYNYTYLVAEETESISRYDDNEVRYYSSAFRVTKKTWSSNKDFIDCRTILKDDVSGVRNIRFAEGLNLKNTTSKFSNWGKAKNRFGSIMLLGYADYPSF